MIEASIAVGVLAAAAAGACYDTGYALQALEARRVHERHALRPSLLGVLVRRPVWVGATALSLVGWPLQITALSLAPLTLVQPTLALGLLLLLVLGKRVLGEDVGGREVVAVLALIAGVAVIAWAAPARGEAMAAGYGLAAALVVLGSLTLAPYLLGARSGSGSLLLVLGAGAGDGLAAFLGKLISDQLLAGRWAAAAAWAAATALAVGLGIVSEMTALQRAPATRVAPAVLVMQIMIPVALAPLVGGESWGATPLGGGALVAALAAVLVATGLLGGSRAVGGIIGASAREDEIR